MRRRLGRPKAGQEALTRERILDTALQLVDRQGLEVLSMRRLATELGVDPMAIYHHLPGKQAVLGGVVALVFGELQVASSAAGSWQDRVRDFAAAYHRLARAHPNLVLYLVSDPNTAFGSTPVLEANEILYSALAAAGLPSRMIVCAADLVVDYLNGFALAESSGHAGQPGMERTLPIRLEEHPPERFPSMRRVMQDLAEQAPADDFHAGLDIILAGIAAIAGSSNEQCS